MRCKFRATSVRHVTGTYGPPGQGFEQEELELKAVTGPDNEPWSKYTPFGELKLTVSNPVAWGSIEGGKDYYIDIARA